MNPPSNRGARVLEIVSEVILYAILIGSPWVFGTTDRWAVNSMTGMALGFGALRIASKYFSKLPDAKSPHQSLDPLVRMLTWANLLFLTYLALSIVNARATFDRYSQSFTYYEAITWLPTTYHRRETIARLWEFLGFTALFWGLRDWLLSAGVEGRPVDRARGLPPKFRRLLWTLSINAALLAAFAIFQRFSGTDKIFWVYPLKWGDSQGMFGPYPYRSNAVQYLNLLWPAMVGFWFLQKQLATRPGKRDGPHTLLGLMTMVVALAPFISLSRGGLLVTVFIAGVLAVSGASKLSRTGRAGLAIAIVMMLGLTWHLTGSTWLERFQREDLTLSGRTEIFENSKKIMKDFPVFGTGAGSFAAMYNLYREGPNQRWHAYLHNDWWEARLTLGWVGFSLQCTLGALVGILAFRRRGGPVTYPIPNCIALGLVGCMAHALVDFPFRIWSILALFTTLCALVTVYPLRSRRG